MRGFRRKTEMAHILFWHESIYRYQTRLTAHRMNETAGCCFLFVCICLKIDQTKRSEMKKGAAVA